jgi:hippurate hydrolase
MKRATSIVLLFLGIPTLTGLLTAQQAERALAASSQKIGAMIDLEYLSLVDLYRHLHANPELSFHETRTARRMAEELEKAGYQVTSGFGGTGVVGILRNGTGPTVLIRTDMDALPVVEETGLEYASRVHTKDDQGREVGVMHACGHDMHMTCFVGTARLLGQMKQSWRGTLVMVAQPAEERSGGAKAMLEAGLFRNYPRPDYALALHVDSNLEAGKVGLCEGDALAGVDSLDLTVRGVSGHGAYPYRAKDPVVLSAEIILALQTIVSRELRAIDPAVVTVGSIHGGAKHNIIPDEVQLQLTIRYYSDKVRDQILKSIERISMGTAQAAGIPPDRLPVVKVLGAEHLPPVYNNPELTHQAGRAIETVLGVGNVVKNEPVMGAEDFAYYGRTPEKVPICIFWLGTVNPARWQESEKPGAAPLPSIHSSRFAPDTDLTIRTGIKAMTAAALDLLGK